MIKTDTGENNGSVRRLDWRAVLVCIVLIGPVQRAGAEVVTVVSPKGPLPSVLWGTTKVGEGLVDKDAAADLCDYLSRVSGRKIAPLAKPAAEGVIIHVGADAFVRKHAPEVEKLFADGYIVKYVARGGRGHVILAGRMGPSSQWAVEQFLKDFCGVRWLFPYPKHGEVVPSRPTITIDSALSKTYEPDYVSRANCGMYYFTPARQYLRLRSYGGGGGYGDHAIQHIFSTKEFEAHPEWFAYFTDTPKVISYRGLGKTGKPTTRRQWWKYGNGWQICTTNPDTVKHAVKYALDYFRKYPDVSVVSVGPNDGSGWCQCPKCRKFVNSFDPPYTISERWFHWVNQVAREVGKVYPDKWVESLAYGNTSALPRFPLEPNVAITKTIVLGSELKQAEQWMKVCKSVNLYSYMYGRSFLGFRHYPHAARDFLKWGYDKLGARAHITECGGDWTFDGPKYHYLQAIQWDVNADIDAVMEDFCRYSYGKAAGVMRKFWDRLEEVYEKRRPLPYGMINRRFLFYQWVGWQQATYLQPNDELQEYTLQDVGFLDKCIAEAAGLAANDTEGVQFRLQRLSDAWKYYRTMLVSYLEYFNVALAPQVASGQSRDAALKLAREITDLRTSRNFYLGKLRAYRHGINPRMAKRYYWSSASGMTLFSHERTLLDELCTAVSGHIKKSGGVEAALKFWRKIPSSDSLSETARTQIYVLSHTALPDLLANGDFEDGTLDAWQVSGAVKIVRGKARNGTHCVEMTSAKSTLRSQRLPVSPQERYRLSVWVKHLTAPVGTTTPLEVITRLRNGEKQQYREPLRCMLRTRDPADGWVRLNNTLTVSPGADNIEITIKKKFKGTVLLDDVKLERIKGGPRIEPGTLSDTFTGDRIDRNKWFQATSSGGTEAPKVAGGWLVYSGSNMLYPLTAYAAFNDLIEHEGKNRYRLRLHASAQADTSKPSSLSWGIKSGTASLSTRDSGMFWTHHFSTPKRPKGYLLTYAYEHGARTHSGYYVPKNLAKHQRGIWYTMYFDPVYVTVYAATEGYDDSKGSLVARYEHKIKDITDKGSIYLKLSSGNSMLDEISLRRPPKDGAKNLSGPKKD